MIAIIGNISYWTFWITTIHAVSSLNRLSWYKNLTSRVAEVKHFYIYICYIIAIIEVLWGIEGLRS